MIVGLDHTGLALQNLDEGRRLFERLGFTLTPREALTRPGADGEPVSTGADNHVFMMESGYQELISIVDPSLGHGLVPRLGRYWGLHIVVLATDDADTDRAAMASRGVAVSACMNWGREVPGRGEARFKFFVVDDRDAPECMLGVVEHLTPEKLRTPELLRHRNGAKAILGATLHVEDLGEAGTRFGRILGMPASGEFHLGNGTYLRLNNRDGFVRAHEGVVPPPAPSFAAVEYAVGRMEAIEASGVPLRRDGAARWLAPKDAFGALVRFVPG